MPNASSDNSPATVSATTPVGASPPPIDDHKSFLSQKFAKIPLGSIHLIGYSVAGEETVVQVPELNVCFDIGRCPYFALTSDIICLSHGHMDHVAGLPYYLSQRFFQGMKPGTILLPRELERPVDTMLRCWRDIERQNTPYTLIPLQAGELYEVRRDFGIRTYATHHGGPSLGFGLISIREKLKPELLGRPGPELAAMRKAGEVIQYRLEVPMVVFLGDTTAGPVFDQPDVQNAEVLITEVTFFEADHRSKAKAGRHLHVDQFAEIVPRLKNKWIVLTHVSRRTGVPRAMRVLRRKLDKEQLSRILFLLDFDGSADAGDVDSAGPVEGAE